MRFAVALCLVLAGCAQQELIATREGMAACDSTLHADYVRRVQADPQASRQT